MHLFGFTTWGWGEIAEAADMTTWKYHAGRIFVAFPRHYDREVILAALASAMETISSESLD